MADQWLTTGMVNICIGIAGCKLVFFWTLSCIDRLGYASFYSNSNNKGLGSLGKRPQYYNIFIPFFCNHMDVRVCDNGPVGKNT